MNLASGGADRDSPGESTPVDRQILGCVGLDVVSQAENREEQFMLQLGALSIGARTVCAYPDSVADEIGFLLEHSDAAIVISAFLLATLFTPIRNQLQALVDKRFKDSRDLERLMAALERDVISFIGIVNPHRLAERLLEDAREGAGAPGGAIYLDARADLTALSQGSWDESTAASVPLRVGGRNVGRLDLGRRNNGVGFAPRDLEYLQKAADVVAAAISVSHESHTVGAASFGGVR